jgi:endonuclease YncB( thermonuclease family)
VRSLGACLLFLTACAHPWATPPRPHETFTARLERVIDGDTLAVTVRGQPVRVRLLDLDTPERGQPGWQAATDAARRQYGPPGTRLSCTISITPRDAFGRILARCNRPG